MFLLKFFPYLMIFQFTTYTLKNQQLCVLFITIYFILGQIVTENSSTPSNMTFFHVSDDPRIQVTCNPDEGM